MRKRRGEEKEPKQGSCSAIKEVADALKGKPALASLGCTHVPTHTRNWCYLLRFNTGADASQ